MPRPEWLNVTKRGVKKERKLMKLSQLAKYLETRTLPYKTNFEMLHLRDQALISLLLLSGLRISEALKLRLSQFDLSDAKFAIIKDVETVKRGLPREEIPLPKEGQLSPFSEILFAWLLRVDGVDSFVFPPASIFGIHWNRALSKQRCHVIVKAITTKYPHYFRAMCESHYGRIFRTNWALKDFMGLTDLRSTEPYVKTDWRDYAEKMLQ